MNDQMDEHASSYNPVVCLTHSCNLNCVYCYQHHHGNENMHWETAKWCVDDIMKNVPAYANKIYISFIGGEPLLRFPLIARMYDYVFTHYQDPRIFLFATTNGTLLTDSMKEWFYKRRKKMVLGLSLDGTKETHDFNRSNSYDRIDTDFFIDTWPNEGVKMTISLESINSFADNVIHLHALGFKHINGVNLAEGDFDWSNPYFIRTLSKQLSKLVDFYDAHPNLKLDQCMGKHIELCANSKKVLRKACGVGINTIFYDIDGQKYPCNYLTPMTFGEDELEKIRKVNFKNTKLFVDEDCMNSCYLYPICGDCSGADYLVNHTFSKRNKSKCRLIELIALYIAELHARRITKHRELYTDDTQLYFLIQSILGIRSRYLEKFRKEIGNLNAREGGD